MDFVNGNTHSTCAFLLCGNRKDRTKNNGYLWHGELACSGAIIGIKGLGGDNPFTPANICKVHFKVPPGTIARFNPLLSSCLLQGLFIKLERLALLVRSLSLFLFVLTLFRALSLKSLVRFSLLPYPILLILIFCPRKLIVLQRQQDPSRALLPPFSRKGSPDMAIQFGHSSSGEIPVSLQA